MSKGAETRERIVERAWQLASRDGLSGLSIGKLASDLGLSKSGLFAHFGSKEDLEIEVLRAAAERFVTQVVRPAIQAPRGVPRLRQLFKNWLVWVNHPGQRGGGCIFLAAAAELDDVPGPQRDFVAATQTSLLATVSKAARIAVEERQLRARLDCEQFAYELLGIMMAYHHTHRLLRDPKAETRAKTAFERLLAASAAAS